MKQVSANTQFPVISHHIIYATIDGKRTAWEATKVTKDLCLAMLGTDEVYLVQCGIEAHPNRFANHTIVATQKQMDALQIEELNPCCDGVSDIQIYGPCFIGPSWCFEQLEEDYPNESDESNEPNT